MRRAHGPAPVAQSALGLAAELADSTFATLFAGRPRAHSALSLETLDLLCDFQPSARDELSSRALRWLSAACALEGSAHGPVRWREGQLDRDRGRPCTWRCAICRSVRCRAMASTSCRRSAPSLAQDARLRHAACTEGGSPASRGARFTDVVNIGIGGSDLGIVMASEALARYRNRNIAAALRIQCRRRRELSRCAGAGRSCPHAVRRSVRRRSRRSETLTNAHAARDWMIGELGERRAARALRRSVDQRHPAMDAFGVSPRRTIHDLGLGGRSLFAVVGRGVWRWRSAWIRCIRADAGRWSGRCDEHFRAAPFAAQPAGADGLARRLEPELPRR